MERAHDGGIAQLLRFLVAYRLLFYVGGLIAMSLPLGLVWLFDVTIPSPIRLTIVGVSFGLILATYLAERRVGLDHVDPQTGAPRETYSLRLRISVLLAIVGIAVGVYSVLSGRRFLGVLFLGGALLFFQVAYRSDRTDDGADDA